MPNRQIPWSLWDVTIKLYEYSLQVFLLTYHFSQYQYAHENSSDIFLIIYKLREKNASELGILTGVYTLYRF